MVYCYSLKRYGNAFAEKYCNDCFLSKSTMNYMRDLSDNLARSLRDLGIELSQVPLDDMNDASLSLWQYCSIVSRYD